MQWMLVILLGQGTGGHSVKQTTTSGQRATCYIIPCLRDKFVFNVLETFTQNSVRFWGRFPGKLLPLFPPLVCHCILCYIMARSTRLFHQVFMVRCVREVLPLTFNSQRMILVSPVGGFTFQLQEML